MGNEAGKRPVHDPLVDLDDPGDFGLADEEEEERAPDTKRPSFEPIQFARLVESAEDRATLPPAPTYEMLRDSCKEIAIAEDVLLDDSAVHPKESVAVRAAKAVTRAVEEARRKAKG